MIYLYCPRPSSGARELVNRIKQLGYTVKRAAKPVFPAAELIINWGSESLPQTPFTFNATIIHNKWKELEKLATADILVPKHSKTPIMGPGWLARKFKHQSANDLLAKLQHGDYYVLFVPSVKEFRVHVWRGKSIRAGMKVPRVPNPHPHFRSYLGGWKLDYGTICQDNITNRVRKAAKNAVDALGLDFGAVDVGLLSDGAAIVYEVNTAPGLEGNTIGAYANAIIGELGSGA